MWINGHEVCVYRCVVWTEIISTVPKNTWVCVDWASVSTEMYTLLSLSVAAGLLHSDTDGDHTDDLS